MNKILALLITSALTLGMGSAFAGHHDSEKSNAAPVETKKAPSFLFVVSAKKAHIKKDKDGNTLLVIKKSDLSEVIEFSDRPYRIIKYITGSDIAKDWGKGKNSFVVDPPNAVLSSANVKPYIVVINGMTLTDDALTLSIDGVSARNMVHNTSNEVTSLALVIDRVSSHDLDTSCYQWRQGQNCTPCGGVFQTPCYNRNKDCPCF